MTSQVSWPALLYWYSWTRKTAFTHPPQPNRQKSSSRQQLTAQLLQRCCTMSLDMNFLTLAVQSILFNPALKASSTVNRRTFGRCKTGVQHRQDELAFASF